MKLLLILSSIFLLASCQQYKYEVTYEKCNGQTGSVIFNTTPRYKLYRPEKSIVGDAYDSLVTDVCDFTYVRTPITE